MGCISSAQVLQPRREFSLTGRPVKEFNNLQARVLISQKEYVPIELVREFVLISHLNKEIAFRLKEDSPAPRNNESEFIDLRSSKEFQKSHMLLFQNIGSDREQPLLSAPESSLKILFDFKHLFLLADSSDERVLTSSKSVLISDEASMQNGNLNAALLTSDQFRIPSMARNFIKLISLKQVKPKSFSIISTKYSQLEQTFPNYIVINNTDPKIKISESQNLSFREGADPNDPTSHQLKLLGDNAILGRTIFSRIQLPLLIYDHSDFLASNNKESSNPQALIYLQSLPIFLSNLSIPEGKSYYEQQLKIATVLFTCEPNGVQGLNLPSTTINLKVGGRDNKIKAMKYLQKNVENEKSILIIRDSNKEGFIDAITVFKCMLYEKYQVFTTQIQDYLTISTNKTIAYQAQNSTSQQPNVEEKEKMNKEISERVFVQNDKKQNEQKQNEQLSRVEEMQQLLVQIVKDNKKNRGKYELFIETLSQVLDNIIKNPNEPKFKQLKKDNKRLKESVYAFKQSSQLLLLCGFVDNQEVYNNYLTSTDLTIIKTDLDLAFKNAILAVY